MYQYEITNYQRDSRRAQASLKAYRCRRAHAGLLSTLAHIQRIITLWSVLLVVGMVVGSGMFT